MAKNNLEAKLEELNSYVEIINSEETTLEKSIEIYEKAVTLSKECYEILKNANGKIQELSKHLENTITDIKEFD